MATDAQLSGPLPGEKFTLSRWFEIFGDDMGIVGDTDGSAFGITLPSGSTEAEVGSATVKSVAVIGGHPLIIPAGQTQSLDIPDSVGGGATGRTDRIVAKRDPATYATAPGPVRLHRIPGTEGSAEPPAYDPRTELRMYRVTRIEGQGLNQAIAIPEKTWLGRSLVVSPDTSLTSLAAPLGTRVRRGTQEFVRQLVGGAPTWVDALAHIGKYQAWAPQFNTSLVQVRAARYRRIGDDIKGYVRVLMESNPGDLLLTLPVPARAVTGAFLLPMGTAIARRDANSGAQVFKAFAVNPNTSGSITKIAFVEAGAEAGGQWRGGYPFAWSEDNGTELGIEFAYEAAS